MNGLSKSFFNINVWGTNILLIIVIIFSGSIIYNINHWKPDKDIDPKDVNTYKNIWLFITIYFVALFLFSTLYHITMYTKYTKLHKVGQIDPYITAPGGGLILIILNIGYFKYLNKNDSCAYHDKYTILYYVSLIMSLLGVVLFVLKTKTWSYIYNIDIAKNIKYMISHVAFHYIIYTGLILQMLFYYIESKNIFYTFFVKNKCPSDSYASARCAQMKM